MSSAQKSSRGQSEEASNSQQEQQHRSLLQHAEEEGNGLRGVQLADATDRQDERQADGADGQPERQAAGNEGDDQQASISGASELEAAWETWQAFQELLTVQRYWWKKLHLRQGLDSECQ